MPRPRRATEGLAAAEPASRHLGTLDGEVLPSTECFDEADMSDKPAGIASQPRISAAVAAEITSNYRRYLEALLAVDEGVAQIIGALEDTGELDETVVIFTSDNGFLFGEHRIPTGKAWFYDDSILVPLVVRGPGFESGTANDSLVGNIDLAPTILELAGAEPLRTMDGVSLVPLFGGRTRPSRAIDPARVWWPLLPQLPGCAPTATPTSKRVLARSSSTTWRTDPAQLDNRHGDPALAEVEADLAERLARLRTCSGETCR